MMDTQMKMNDNRGMLADNDFRAIDMQTQMIVAPTRLTTVCMLVQSFGRN